jgi:CRISPR/Cas system-associated endoribonuclease Cas2
MRVSRVLAELADCCDFAADRLAVWWPFEGLRLVWRQDRLQVGAREGVASRGLVRLPARIGNFVVCYDVTDPEALEAVAAIVAGETAMLQRSVYWLRAPAARLGSLMAHCAVHLGERDQLWAYPLGGNHELWQVGTRETAILPIATHHWRAP